MSDEMGGANDMGGAGETSVPAGGHEDPADRKAAPDDEFDRALRSLTEGTTPSARLREPSAAERQKLAAQALKKRERARKRYAKLEKKDRKEEQRQRSRDERKARPLTSGRWSRGRSAGWAAVIVVLGGGAWFGATHLRLASLTGAGGPNDTQVVTNGAAPATSPVSSVNPWGPSADPFAGTAADNWADGAAGIVIPQAKPVGEYSTAQVRYAYETTKKLLSAAALDMQTLRGGVPTSFANLLSQPNRTRFIGDLNKIGLDEAGRPVGSRDWVISFAPGTTKLIGSVIKVNGTMSAHATTDSYGAQVLHVKVNYLFAYPVEPPGAPEDWMRVVAHFDGYIAFGDWSGAQTPFEPWWTLGHSAAGLRCSMPDGYAHPDFPSGPPNKVQPSGPAVDPYSSQQNNMSACGSSTGT